MGNLEKMSEHEKTVRESTKATRDVYKNTDTKIRDYERESRRNYEDDAPVIRRHVTAEVSSKPAAPVTSAASRPSNNYSSVAQEEVKTESVRGNWRRDIAKFEENLTANRKQETKISSPAAPAVSSSSATSWSRPTVAASSATTTATTRTSYSSSTTSPESTTDTTSTSSSWRDKFKKYGSDNTETAKSVPVSKPAEVPKSVSSSKPAEVAKPVTITKPVETPKPASVPKPVEAPKPVSAPKPVETPKPVSTPKPVDTPK